VADSDKPVKMVGPLFVAKTCNSRGEITGLLDECEPIAPSVVNRAPMIQAAPGAVSAATGAAVSFTFTVADTKSDYLVLTMTYGDGAKESVLLVNEDAMIAMMGKAAWDAKLTSIKQLYGITKDPVARALDSQSYTFTHSYTSGAATEWTFSVTDSSNAQTTTTGALSLQTAQNFIFNTVYKTTNPASGYILWDNGADQLTNWTFGATYTSNSLIRTAGSTLLTVAAYPFPAGYRAQNPAHAAALERFTGGSDTYDSFFYKWSATTDFEALLPTGAGEEERRYESVLSFNRAYVKDGEATDSAKWQDIQLSAIFVAEYLSSDAIKPWAKDGDKPYLYELGDYNQDGVPDGWILRQMGTEARATLIEGASVANASPAVSADRCDSHRPHARLSAGPRFVGMADDDPAFDRGLPSLRGSDLLPQKGLWVRLSHRVRILFRDLPLDHASVSVGLCGYG
jgi:hypothetical protein